MRKLVLAALIVLVPAMFCMNCGGPPPPVEETTEPVVEEPAVEPEEETEIEEEVTPEPEPVESSDFKEIYFDFDKYNLVDSAKEALEHNAMILRDNPGLIIQIEGHCDKRGTDKYNLSLGQNRADAAKDYLVQLGIGENRLTTISYGKKRLAFEGDTEAIHAKNRRCEFKIESR